MNERKLLVFMLIGTVILSLVIGVIFVFIIIPDVQIMDKSYPRLGMWWLDPHKASVQEMARYDLLIDNFDNPELTDKLKALRNESPNQRIFKPIGPSERSHFIEDPETGEKMPNPEVKRLPSQFFLSQTGTQLTFPVNPHEVELIVDQMYDGYGAPYFQVGGTLMIGNYESAKVLAIDEKNKKLTVERGYVRPASDHTAGTRIASHIEFWPGTWVMNMTSTCPQMYVYKVKVPVNYAEYYLLLAKGKAHIDYPPNYNSPDLLINLKSYDGIVLDRLEDRQSFLKWQEDKPIQLDINHDNISAEDRIFDELWLKGISDFVEQLRIFAGNMPIIRNNPLSQNQLDYQGQIFETTGWSEPNSEWWESLVVENRQTVANQQTEAVYSLPYLKWSEDATLLLEVYEDESFPDENLEPLNMPEVPNYQRMRFGLTSALLGNGYYSYELNNNGHGSLGLMWFDEYDLGSGKRGYLGHPTGTAQKVADHVYLRRFSKGIVVVNASDREQTVKLGKYYQHILGTQDPDHNTGEIAQQVVLDPYDGVILLKLPLLYFWTYQAQQFEE